MAKGKRNRGLKWGLTAASVLATLIGWKNFAGAGPQPVSAGGNPTPAAESAAPAPDSGEYVRMAVVTGPDGSVYLVPLSTGSAPPPAPMVRTQSSR